jgi:hypothetical protein
MIDIFHIYILNLVVTVGLFIATLYRAKIERDLANVTIKNAELYHALKVLRENLKYEKLTDEEIREFVNELIRECE